MLPMPLTRTLFTLCAILLFSICSRAENDPSATLNGSSLGLTAGKGHTRVRLATEFSSIQAAIDDLGGQPGVVFVPPGNFNTAGKLTLRGGQYLKGAGIKATRIVYTGSTPLDAVIDVGTSLVGAPHTRNVGVSDLTISGNRHVSYGIRLRSVHHSVFENISIKNIVSAGLKTYFCVLNEYRNIRVTNEDEPFDVTPKIGLSFDTGDGTGSRNTTASVISNPIVEGVSGIGIDFVSANNMTVIGGTAEGVGIGMRIGTADASANTSHILIYGTSFEANKTANIVVNAHDSLIENVVSMNAKPLTVTGTASSTTIIAGRFYPGAINIQERANKTQLINVHYDALDDQGVNTLVLNADAPVFNGHVGIGGYSTFPLLVTKKRKGNYIVKIENTDDAADTYALGVDIARETADAYPLLVTAGGKNKLVVRGNGDTNISGALSAADGIISDRLRSGTSSNTDLAGQLTLCSGSASYRFSGEYTSAPICTCTDTTTAAACTIAASTTMLTITGRGSDVVNYVCVGRN
jgi:hypothetical protein